MKNINWNNVEEVKEYEKVPAGGYIAVITAVTDVPDKEYLMIEFDIADGKFKGYYDGLYRSKGFWGCKMNKSYKETALSFFKAFKTTVEHSNKNYTFNNDETTLKGKFVGIVLAEEEYRANDGTVKTRLYVANTYSIQKIQSGDFKIPPIKKLTPSDAPQGFSNYAPSSNDDLPF